MEQVFGKDTMQQIYTMYRFQKGGGPGGDFTGGVLRQILDNLEGIRMMLPESAADYISYLEAFKDVYYICVNQKLPERYIYEQKIARYQETFHVMHENHGLSETLKCHIFFDHIFDFFESEQVTMAKTNDEMVEVTHGKLSKAEKKSQFKRTKNLSGAGKRKAAHSSLTHFNSKKRKFQ